MCSRCRPILVYSLTVEEHLQFFGRIKGIKAKVLNAEIDSMLAEMNLEVSSVGLCGTRRAQQSSVEEWGSGSRRPARRTSGRRGPPRCRAA